MDENARFNAYQLFSELSRRSPERRILLDGSKPLRYADLLVRCDDIAHTFEQAKLGKGMWIAVCLSGGAELVLTYFAAVRLGIGVVFLPPDTDLAELARLGQMLPLHGYVAAQGYVRLLSSGCGNVGCPDASMEVVFQTSGTVGPRKLVRIAQQHLLERTMACYEFDEAVPDALKLIAVPAWHLTGVMEVMRAILTSMPACIPLEHSVEQLLACCGAVGVTSVVIRSSMLSQILYHSQFCSVCLENLRILRYCLEPMPMETLMQAQALFPKVRFYSDYVLTEAVGTIAILGPEAHQIVGGSNYLPSVGVFLPEVDAKLVDRWENEVSEDEVGELSIHVPWQYIGYVGSDVAEYCLSTGDMGWIDSRRGFNLSGFRTKLAGTSQGNLYVLPAVARKKYVNIPSYRGMFLNRDRHLEQFQELLMLLHGSLDTEEIKCAYLTGIPNLILADAYGFESFTLDTKLHAPAMAGANNWYQDAFQHISQQSVLIRRGNPSAEREPSIALAELEYHWGMPVDVLYVPLYSRGACLHGAISFARASTRHGFTSAEITLVKQLSHHLNLALLNARMFQEIETRQILMQKALDISEVGTVLSSSRGTIYYLNSAMEEMLDREDTSPVRMSCILDKFRENLTELEKCCGAERTVNFLCYFKCYSQPVYMSLRTMRLSPESEFIASFLSTDLNRDSISFGSLDQALTEREAEALTHLCHGLQYKEIAEQMCVSLNTVNYFIKQIYRKMEVNSRSEILNRVLYLGSNNVHYRPWINSQEKQEEET